MLGRTLKKLVFVDLDGTVIDNSGRPFSGIPEAVTVLGSRGTGVVLATGRMLCSAADYARRLGLHSIVIAYNGALVADTATGKWIRHTPLPRDLAAAAAEAVDDENTTIMCFIEDRYLVNKMNSLVREYEQRSGVTARVVRDLYRTMPDDPTKLLLASAVPGTLARTGAVLADLFGGQLYTARSRPGYLEVLARGVHKGAAARFVCRRLGVKPEESAACGDNMNDFEMLSMVGFGVAVSGAPEKLKNIARKIVASPEAGDMAAALLSLR